MGKIQIIRHINTIYAIILFFLGIFFGKIRSELFDGADRLYEMIAFKINYFGHFRFSTNLNGILPWIISHFTDSPNLILYSFILNYSLTPFLFLLLFRHYFKDEYLVTFFLLGLTMFYTILFFHPNHDVLFGYYYTILLYGFLRNRSSHEKLYLFKVFIICILYAFTHQSQFPSTILLIFYLKYFQKKDLPLFKIITLLLSAFIIKLLFFTNGYEMGIYSEIFEFKDRLLYVLKSPLIITFLKSFITTNIMVSFVFFVTAYVLIKNKNNSLLFFIIIHVFFTLGFIAFFFPNYPYVFATEGYLKGATLILSIVFIDLIVFNPKFILFHNNIICLSITYAGTIVVIWLNGINYSMYYDNIKYISQKLKCNTVYYNINAQNLEQYFILHRESALINLTENNKCYYFQYVNDTFQITNQVVRRDISNDKLCFGKERVIEIPSKDIKALLDNQYSLIFNLTDLKSREMYQNSINQSIYK